MEQDIKTQLLTKKPMDLLFQLSIPAVIGMIVIGLYPLMDGVFVGKIIGQTAIPICPCNDSFANDIWSKSGLVYATAGRLHHDSCGHLYDAWGTA